MIDTEYLDGVRLLRHRNTQEHTDVSLTFAVGARDETLRTVGVAHTVEHLVMSTVRQLPIQLEAEVDLMTTTFAASGSPARVGAGMARGIRVRRADGGACDCLCAEVVRGR